MLHCFAFSPTKSSKICGLAKILVGPTIIKQLFFFNQTAFSVAAKQRLNFVTSYLELLN